MSENASLVFAIMLKRLSRPMKRVARKQQFDFPATSFDAVYSRKPPSISIAPTAVTRRDGASVTVSDMALFVANVSFAATISTLTKSEMLVPNTFLAAKKTNSATHFPSKSRASITPKRMLRRYSSTWSHEAMPSSRRFASGTSSSPKRKRLPLRQLHRLATSLTALPSSQDAFATISRV